jgi:hypothetical protein
MTWQEAMDRAGWLVKFGVLRRPKVHGFRSKDGTWCYVAYLP